MNQPQQVSGTIIGNPVPFKDVENDKSSYVVRMMLDEPFVFDKHPILDVFVHIPGKETDLHVGTRIRVSGELTTQHVITRSGKSGRRGIVHIRPLLLERL
ncbi:hypothetical protein LSG31_11280 [Fodinisporobacter ferrooxydans]|uniref:Single-stranded DNA-binding protein n=1 Tax=Fodinisporobacter ferrooxydans TaxID=2901836 RepID=A0ABY4CTY0_9BACL|nr:hypothetical protein LSG31_11280 [Alicyclobacillaceae bacterium MYW30-H2]